ncbi:hypothetical protein HYU96_03335 [Candidatus Daviesbacteria bacterium]|nr:hypothetical protein [Candidatus Daviesbacteria bacterium]
MNKNKQFKRIKRIGKNKSISTTKLIRLIKEYETPKLKLTKTAPAEIYLSAVDRIYHAGAIDEKGDLIEVTNISYEINLDDKWVTIVRYDSAHGYLHRHKRISLDDPADTVDRIGVKQKGKPRTWYTWAIKDIQKRFLHYREEFTKRSEISNLGY